MRILVKSKQDVLDLLVYNKYMTNDLYCHDDSTYKINITCLHHFVIMSTLVIYFFNISPLLLEKKCFCDYPTSMISASFMTRSQLRTFTNLTLFVNIMVICYCIHFRK